MVTRLTDFNKLTTEKFKRGSIFASFRGRLFISVDGRSSYTNARPFVVLVFFSNRLK